MVLKVSSFNSASFDMLHDHVRSAPSKIAGGECVGDQIFEFLKFQSAINQSFLIEISSNLACYIFMHVSIDFSHFFEN